MLPKMSACRRNFDDIKCMTFLIKDDESLEKHNKIWDKVSNTTKKEFESSRVYNEKYLKTKIKFYDGKINTNSHGDKVPKGRFQRVSLSVISIDSIFGTGKNYHPQVFLE